MVDIRGKYMVSLEMRRPIAEYALLTELYTLEARYVQKKAGLSETVMRFFNLDSPPEITGEWVTLILPGAFVVRLATSEIVGVYSNDNQP